MKEITGVFASLLVAGLLSGPPSSASTLYTCGLTPLSYPRQVENNAGPMRFEFLLTRHR